MPIKSLNHRRLRPEDAEVCADWLVREERLQPRYFKRLRARLRTFVEQECIQGVLIYDEKRATKADAVAGIGISGFVASQCIDQHLQEPRPLFLSSLLLDQANSSPFLDRKSVARSNSGGGLDLVAHLMLGNWDLSSGFWRQAGTLAHEAYVKDHSGYRINRALQEDWQRPFDIYLATGYRLHTSFPARTTCRISEPFDTPRNLYCADAKLISEQAPGTSLSFVLQWAPPRCSFTSAEQRLLAAASNGLTDAQLVRELGISLNTIKTLWRTIYDRVRTHLPEVIGVADVNSEFPTRGQELRRSVVSYVQRHPEELRPFATKHGRK